MKDNNPLSPHIQIYNWHISSLVSISHRIIGVLNVIVMTLICGLVCFLLLGDASFNSAITFFDSFFGKFFIIGITWSFCFQILSEIRHLFWDIGIGFDIKVANRSGMAVIVGSFLMTICIYLIGTRFL